MGNVLAIITTLMAAGMLLLLCIPMVILEIFEMWRDTDEDWFQIFGRNYK